MKKPIIILDCNALCHKAKYTMGELSHEDSKVGVIFGFFVQLLKLAKTYETNQFVHCWDSNRSHRQKLFPAYKEKRRTMKEEKTPEEIEEDKAAYVQFDQLYEKYLPAIGFKNNFKFDGFEGDDIIASLVDNNLDDFLIASGDEDLYQCICEGVSLIKQKGVYGEQDFITEYGIGPQRWAEVKAIAGCTTDEVPGIRGVGEKTAIKFLKGELTPNVKGYQSITSQEGKQIIARNTPLVSLPFKGCPHTYYHKDHVLCLDAFMDMCNELGFLHFLKKEQLQQWKQYLNMK